MDGKSHPLFYAIIHPCHKSHDAVKLQNQTQQGISPKHDDVIKWKHFPRHCPFVRGTHRSPVNSPHKGQWRGALMFSLTCAWINNLEAGDLRRHRTHYDISAIRLDFVEISIKICNFPLKKMHLKVSLAERLPFFESRRVSISIWFRYYRFSFCIHSYILNILGVALLCLDRFLAT